MSESRKRKAEMAREAYVHHLSEAGIHLTSVLGTRRAVYETASGKTVRIPFANEKNKGDAWWWGLPNAKILAS